MPLMSAGPAGRVTFYAGVKFDMIDERNCFVEVALASEMPDFLEGGVPEEDVACFLRFRSRIEQVASDLYDDGLVSDGRVIVTYGDLRRLRQA